jgi:hypothetical protein
VPIVLLQVEPESDQVIIDKTLALVVSIAARRRSRTIVDALVPLNRYRSIR